MGNDIINQQEQINKMLSLIMDSSHPMPDFVFHYYLDYKKKPEEKIFYNLIADSFLTLFSYCKLMFEQAWSQAFTVLRMGIEQVAAVFLLTHMPGAIEKYIDLHKLKAEFVKFESEDDKKTFRKENNIPGNYNNYFDYSWVSSFTVDGKYGRSQMVELAGLGEFLGDIEQLLNAFSHGSINVFQMNGDNWKVMKRYGRRASLICCKLYDFLCCSYHNLIGSEEFAKTPLNICYKQFKQIYHDLFVSEGWIKNDQL